METQHEHDGEQALPVDDEREESGLPGGGKGRRDEIGHTGVYPVSHMDEASGDAPVKDEMSWGQGERGAAGYEDSGESEISVTDDGTAIPGLTGQGGDSEAASRAAPQSTDPTSPATDPLSGQV